MCHLVSWIQREDAVLFLTAIDIFNTKRGKQLQAYCQSRDDLVGHGAIRFYYGLSSDKGTDCECADFSSPYNFPEDIVKAIKSGQFRGLGTPGVLLTPTAWAEYYKIIQDAQAEYDKAKLAARAEYDKIVQPARAEYDKAKLAARAGYDKIVQPARAECNKIVQPAQAEYDKAKLAARAGYDKIVQPAFWDLFSDPNNRPECWG